MRKIGTVATAEQAGRLYNYLATKNIQTQVEQQPDGWEFWVVEEAEVPVGRQILTEFQANPDDSRYSVKPPPPPPQPKAEQPRRISPPRGRNDIPLTIALIAASVLVTLLSQFGNNMDVAGRFLISRYISGPPLPEIMHGEIWRLYTPMFLHFDPLHLGLDMYVFWMLAGAVERIRGTRALLGCILLIAPVSHLTQYYSAGVAFGGMSGVVFGLFGYMWMRSKFLPGDGIYMPPEIVVQMLVWAAICLLGWLPIANGAHFGGLAAGMVLGVLPRLWRRS